MSGFRVSWGRRLEACVRQAANCLSTARGCALLTHANPDGDAIGSALALEITLCRAGVAATVYAALPLPMELEGVPGIERLRPLEEFRADGRVVVFVDCAAPDRTGCESLDVASAAAVVNLDHHAGNACYGTINVVAPEAAATSEIVWEVLQAMGAEVAPEAATCLYIALVTDCGFFRYCNTRAETLRYGAALLERGVEPAEVFTRIVQTRTPEQIQLLGTALAKLRTAAGGRIGFVTLSRQDFERTGTTYRDTDGVLEVLRTLRSTEVTALLREAPTGIRVSLRSDGCDLRRVAERFGGGGHAFAAGCTLAETLEGAVPRVVEALEGALTEWDGVAGPDVA